MILTTRDGREVEVTVYGEQDDIQIDTAAYVDIEDEVSEDVIEQLMSDYPDVLYEAWFDKQVSIADFMEAD